jgi:hypothetical protein
MANSTETAPVERFEIRFLSEFDWEFLKRFIGLDLPSICGIMDHTTLANDSDDYSINNTCNWRAIS